MKSSVAAVLAVGVALSPVALRAAESIQAAAEAGDGMAYLDAFQRFDRAGTVSSKALRGQGFKVCAAG